MTTAIYDNRKEDKESVEALLHLPEDGEDQQVVFYLNHTPFAYGYVRVVYGDHGPYIEFTKDNIVLPLVSLFNNDTTTLPLEEASPYYYIWLYPVCFPDVKVYWQIKPVTDMPNAPKREDGKKSRFNRLEGYADYKRGMYYVDPYVFLGSNKIIRTR